MDPITEIAHQFAQEQLAAVGAQVVVAVDRTQIERALVDGADDLAKATQARLLSELNRLDTEDRPSMVAHLLATNLRTGRASAWRVGLVNIQTIAQRDLWLSATGAVTRQFLAAQAGLDEPLQKQAIAAVDHNTTETCLRVHGQVQPVNNPFRLVGTPRFADQIQRPPFHWRCRTAVALWSPQIEGVGTPTSDLRAAAQDEIKARQTTGQRERIRPASATSRRK